MPWFSSWIVYPVMTWMISAGTAMPPQSLAAVKQLPIEYDGRLERFEQFSQEVVRKITGQARFGREEPIVTVLHILANPATWRDRDCIAVSSRPLRVYLGLDHEQAYTSYATLAHSRRFQAALLLAQQAKLLGKAPVERELLAVAERFDAMSRLLSHELNLVPPPRLDEEWLPILRPDGYPADQQVAVKRIWALFLEAIREEHPKRFDQAAEQLLYLLENLKAVTEQATEDGGTSRVASRDL